MNKFKLKTIIWSIVIITIDLTLIGYLKHYIANDEGNDKVFILYWFYYPLIVFGNFILWLINKENELKKPLLGIIILLIILFPLLG